VATRTDDDDSDAPPRTSRKAPPTIRPTEGAAAVWQILKWVAFVLGCVLCVIAIGQPAPQGAVWAALACFAGIAARLAQAEEIHLRGK
jgi:hypothetical protein